MVKEQSIKKNFIYQASYEILLMILPLITSPYVSRLLGASNIGIYSYTYSIVYYFTLFAALGIKNYGNREISRVRDDKTKLNKTFSEILFLHIAVSLLVILIYLVYIFVIAQEYQVYYLIQSLYLLGTLLDISWLFFGLELFKVTVMRNAIIRIVSAVSIFVFIRTSDDLWKYILILAVANFASQAYLWFVIKSLVKIVSVDGRAIMKHLPQLVILFVPTIAVSLYNYMDKVMLGTISSKIQLGYYENAFKITTICSSLIGSVGTVMLPRMSNLAAGDRVDESRRYIRLSMEGVAIIACAMAFGLAAIAKRFAPFFWGKGFSASGTLLMLLSIYLPIQGFANVLRTQYLIPNRKDKQYTISLCIGAMINLVINYMLIPKLGAMGAAIGTVLAETAVCIVQVIYSMKELPVGYYVTNNIPYIIFGGIMFACIKLMEHYIKFSVLSLLMEIFVGAVIYLIFNIMYRYIKKDELYYMIAKVIKKN